MPSIRLTDIVIEKLKPASPQITYWDEDLPAFGVRVGLQSKTFIVMHGPKRTRQSLGHYPALSLKDARKRAYVALATEPTTKTSHDTQQVLDEYLRSLQLRPRTIRDYTRLLNRLPLHHKLESIQTQALLGALEQYPVSEARHMYLAASAFFSWCLQRRYLSASPLSNTRNPHKAKTRSRVLTDNELIAIWNATKEPTSFNSIVRLCILTGQRKGEITALQNAWLSETSITFPGNITKNSQEHTIPLSPLSQSLLKEPRIPPHPKTTPHTPSDDSLVFPSHKTGGLIRGWNKLKAALDKKSGIKNWTLHDLRRTFATRLAELGAQPHVIERILNHKTGTLTPLARVYNRASYQREMFDAMNLYDTHFSRLLVQN